MKTKKIILACCFFISSYSTHAITLSQFIDLQNLANQSFTKNPKKLTVDQENFYLRSIPGWTIDRTDLHRLRTNMFFGSPQLAQKFIDQVSTLATTHNVYIEMLLIEKRLNIEIYTPEIRGLTENDFIFASRITTLKFLGV